MKALGRFGSAGGRKGSGFLGRGRVENPIIVFVAKAGTPLWREQPPWVIWRV
jgi:hypothetical protein